jgi:hypothetical protein
MTSAAQSISNPSSARAARVARAGLSAALVVLAMSVAALVLVPRYSRPVAIADVGTIAPDFQLRDTSGRPVTLSDHRGHTVVLFFDEAAAAPAHGAASHRGDYVARIKSLVREYAGDERVAFLGVDEVAPGDGGDATLAASILAADERPFPTLVDDRGVIARRYSAEIFPMVVVIDPRGLVRYRGPFDDNADPAFITRTFAADALHDVLNDRPSAPVARR